MPGLFVTGTDTGVGKTTVAAALLRAARARGLDVGAMKPAESGCARGADGALVPADALRLLRAAGGDDPLDRVCPFRLEAPLAPGIAAAREGVEVSLDAIEAAHRALAARHRHGVVVEGAGGLLVPLDAGFATVADLAVRLALPLLVVARPTLGTINHTALTVEAAAARGLACRGVILNAADAAAEEAATENARAIERLTGVPVLACLPHAPGDDGEVRLAVRLASIDLEQLLA